jgi:diaminohydroxyphosphoribosylaminopyrimidine deaminase/5-amino-6-(5-phosphoribosylamino)uracil reductase
MTVAIEQASLGCGYVEPNPMVGCVVVRNGEVISQGYHQVFGGPHAERVAIPESLNISDATVYVTLEPCSHFGKTPPCAPYLVAKRPQRVVVAMQDPYSEVSGRGLQLLKDNGIAVTVGVCEEQARELNAPYLKRIDTKLPWTIAKWAMSLDGAIATSSGDSKWITNAQSRRVVHEFRSSLDAIVIGIGTALADDPMLTCRLNETSPNLKPARIAARIVMDQNARLPIDSRLVQSAREFPLWVVVGQTANQSSIKQLEKAGAKILQVDFSRDDAQQDTNEPPLFYEHSLREMLRECGRHNFTNIMLEGGAKLLGQAFDAGCVDQIECFIAPKVIGNGIAPVGGIGKKWMRDVDNWRVVKSAIRDGDAQLTLRKPLKTA